MKTLQQYITEANIPVDSTLKSLFDKITDKKSAIEVIKEMAKMGTLIHPDKSMEDVKLDGNKTPTSSQMNLMEDIYWKLEKFLKDETYDTIISHLPK